MPLLAPHLPYPYISAYAGIIFLRLCSHTTVCTPLFAHTSVDTYCTTVDKETHLLSLFSQICRVGQNRKNTTYMTVYLVISLPEMLYTHHIYMVLANPTHMLTSFPAALFSTFVPPALFSYVYSSCSLHLSLLLCSHIFVPPVLMFSYICPFCPALIRLFLLLCSHTLVPPALFSYVASSCPALIFLYSQLLLQRICSTKSRTGGICMTWTN